jgi:hypothetical protein
MVNRALVGLVILVFVLNFVCSKANEPLFPRSFVGTVYYPNQYIMKLWIDYDAGLIRQDLFVEGPYLCMYLCAD